jgi:hypothetical protein
MLYTAPEIRKIRSNAGLANMSHIFLLVILDDGLTTGVLVDTTALPETGPLTPVNVIAGIGGTNHLGVAEGTPLLTEDLRALLDPTIALGHKCTGELGVLTILDRLKTPHG